jgi:hypothetical protein
MAEPIGDVGMNPAFIKGAHDQVPPMESALSC